MLNRFIQPDTVIPSPTNLQAWNKYSYAENNPIKYIDSTGHWVETVFDVISLGMTINDIKNEGFTFWNTVSLVTDVASIILPAVPAGASHLIRAAKYADKAVDLTDTAADTLKATSKVSELWNNAKKAVSNFCSFREDTKVATQEGEKEISEIQQGDYVLAWHEATDEIGYYEVTDTFSHLDPVLTELIIDGEWIETTPEHPFYTLEEGWIPADELETGMHVRQADGDYELVWFKWDIEKDQEMYNFTVDTAHTYFVGEGQWLVHNDCNRAELAANLKSVVNDKWQAHHLIPCEFCDLDVIKKATSDGFNFNGKENGILLPDNLNLSIKYDLPYHRGSHPAWNSIVGDEILDLDNLSRINRWTPNRAHNEVLKLTNRLRNTITNMGGGIRLE